MRRVLMRVTDIGMIGYWVVTAMMALAILDIPGEYLFKDYHDPRVIAWNWSFMPLDVIFAVTGLWALRLERLGDPTWRVWAIVSLTLTHCAGLMAISYWVLVQDFDPTWWVPNLFLMLWPLPFLWQLSRVETD
ncbi:MAG: DUF5360 family protein [Erythrobacter sp.]|uniref:DUF5360 family protein n=1 Tax=Erythrobacter sp. TaxID=1042 RepID=UPI0032654CB7